MHKHKWAETGGLLVGKRPGLVLDWMKVREKTEEMKKRSEKKMTAVILFLSFSMILMSLRKLLIVLGYSLRKTNYDVYLFLCLYLNFYSAKYNWLHRNLSRFLWNSISSPLLLYFLLSALPEVRNVYRGIAKVMLQIYILFSGADKF